MQNSPPNTDLVESTTPPDMTIERWRCDHLHDSVSRYDHAAKRLELLLTCSVCATEKVIHSLAYEPRFEPSG